MTQAGIQEYVFDLSGGRLCLDFANTVGGSRATPKERVNSYLDLVSWGRQSDVLTEQEARRLALTARRHPADAGRVLGEAIRLREALFRIFKAAIEGRPPHANDLEILNTALRGAHGPLQLHAAGSGFEWGWVGDPDALDRMLWPVARSAAALLTSSELARVHTCESSNCDWLFMDTSRNHSRRWCDMKGCGNRAKARRYYERHKTPKPDASR